ncbi:hypothetical protein ALC62_14784, partial [Cyphomyrmex costatus]
FITAWDSCEETKQIYDNLTSRLLKEEQRLTQVEEVNSAFASLSVNKDKQSTEVLKKNESTSSVANKPAFDKKNLECFYCQKKGHFKSECRKRQAKLALKGNNLKEVKSDNHHALIIEQQNAYYSADDWLDDRAATNKGLKVTFKRNKLEIYSNRLLAIGIKQENSCYKMLFKTIENSQACISTNEPAMLWHERLAHVNFQTLKKMIENQQLPGVTTRSVDGLFCEACQHGRLVYHSRKQQKNEFQSQVN